jgi:hypothetical protein
VTVTQREGNVLKGLDVATRRSCNRVANGFEKIPKWELIETWNAEVT